MSRFLRLLAIGLCSGVVLVGAGSVASCTASDREPPSTTAKEFVGSAACESCHQEIYTRWTDTLMANVLQDPKVRPDVILGDFSKPHPLVTFRKEDVAYTYGTQWKQRYFTRIGDDYFVLPAQWDVKNRV